MAIFQNKKIDDFSLATWLAVSLVFMLLMFDRDFGMVYIAIIVAWFFLFLYDKLVYNKKLSFPMENNVSDRGKEILLGVVAYAGFLILTAVIQSLFNPESLSSLSVLDVVKKMSVDMLQAASPAMADSIILMVIGFGFLVPLAETPFFNGMLWEKLYDRIKNKTILVLLALCVVIGVIATLYHITSKGGDSLSLMITFMFFTIAALMVWWRKSLLAALVMHIVANTIAVGFPLIFK